MGDGVSYPQLGWSQGQWGLGGPSPTTINGELRLRHFRCFLAAPSPRGRSRQRTSIEPGLLRSGLASSSATSHGLSAGTPPGRHRLSTARFGCAFRRERPTPLLRQRHAPPDQSICGRCEGVLCAGTRRVPHAVPVALIRGGIRRHWGRISEPTSSDGFPSAVCWVKTGGVRWGEKEIVVSEKHCGRNPVVLLKSAVLRKTPTAQVPAYAPLFRGSQYGIHHHSVQCF